MKKGVQIFDIRKPKSQFTGPELALDLGFYKTTAPAKNNNYFVRQAKKLHLLGADSRTLLNHNMLQSREKHLPWPTPWTK